MYFIPVSHYDYDYIVKEKGLLIHEIGCGTFCSFLTQMFNCLCESLAICMILNIVNILCFGIFFVTDVF